MSGGFFFQLAESDGAAIGFSFWQVLNGLVWLNAFAGPTAEIYYRLARAFCAANLARGLTAGRAEIDVKQTNERGWLSALDAALTYTPHGYEPLAAGQDKSQRVPKTLLVACDLAQLDSAAAAMLGNS
jgi:hypothetical protein